MKFPEMIILIKYYNFNCYLEIINTFNFGKILLSSVNRESCDIFLFCSKLRLGGASLGKSFRMVFEKYLEVTNPSRNVFEFCRMFPSIFR